MKKDPDGRVVRGEQRRRAWQIVANSIVEAGALARREPELTRATIAEILAYARRRARGVMGVPPGGINS
jgi:predicted ATP-dependent protease